MKIPSFLRIKKRINYEVVYQEEIRKDKDCVGISDPEKRLITLLLGRKKVELKKDYIHEVLHAICTENHIEISHKNIYKLEKAIYEFLTLNKYI